MTNTGTMDNLEEDDDTFYYEVEEIIQMHTTDSGVRMFEIKWKNYDHSNNTWEPEHNLNCPSILKAFLENNNNNNRTTEKGKKRRKLSRSPGLISDDDSEGGNAPLAISASITAQPSKKGESSTAQSSKQQGKKKEVVSPHNHTRKEWKTSKVQNGSVKKVADPFRPSPLTPKSIKTIEQRQQQILERQKLLQKREEKDRSAIEAEIRLREKQNRDIQLQEYQLEQKRRKKREEKRLKEMERQQSTGSSKEDRTSEEERQKEVDEAKRLQEERQRKSEALKKHQDEPKMGETSKRKDNSFKLAISDNRSANTTTSNNYASNSNRLADGSFTNLKRPLNGKPGGKDVDIDELVGIAKKPHAQPSWDTQKMFASSPYKNKLTANTSNAKQQQPATAISPPPPPPPPIPAPPIPTGPLNAVVKNPVSQNDPRLKARLLTNDHIPSATHTPASAPFESTKRPMTSSKDPRMKPENHKRLKNSNATAIPTPFSMNTTLFNGKTYVANVLLEGKQTCYHEAQIKELIRAASEDNKDEIKIKYTLPLKSLNLVLDGRPISFMSIMPKDNIVPVSKLKSFYQVNELAGVVQHPTLPQALVILVEADLQKLTNLTRDAIDIGPYKQLCVLFIEDLSPKPKFALEAVQYDLDTLHDDVNSPYAWKRVAQYLRFPEKLLKMTYNTKFMVYGNSDTANMLAKANQELKPLQTITTPLYVMMFDRYKEAVFSRRLTKHKKEISTQIWEFGVPDFSVAQMIPARQVFPDNSGGFITTDMQNIMKNSNIINDIITQVEKLSSVPVLYGEWKFILPHNWLQQLRKLITDAESGQRVKDAVVAIIVSLSSDSIQIMRLWCADSEELSSIQYLDRVAHDKYADYQYFVYVDDGNFVSESDKVASIDFVQSADIFSTFS